MWFSEEERSAGGYGVRCVARLLKPSSVSVSATPSLATHALGASFRLHRRSSSRLRPALQAAPCHRRVIFFPALPHPSFSFLFLCFLTLSLLRYPGPEAHHLPQLTAWVLPLFPAAPAPPGADPDYIWARGLNTVRHRQSPVAPAKSRWTSATRCFSTPSPCKIPSNYSVHLLRSWTKGYVTKGSKLSCTS